MNAAILCPGPSLKYFDTARSRYDLVLGVNRAVTAYAVNVWCFMDWQVFEDTTPLGNPEVLTTQTAYEHVERRGHRWDGWRVTKYEDIRDGYPLKSGPCFTAVMAVYAAFRLGAYRIDLYGADMVKAPDWDGVEMVGNNREADRWEREGALLAELTRELDKRNCVVARVMP